jgi:hypothetical protein
MNLILPLLAIWFAASILPFLLLGAIRQRREQPADHSANLDRVVREFARKRRGLFHNNAGAA